MDSNNNKYKIPDLIIISLFANDKMKKGSKELENYLNNIITEENTQEKLKLVLESFKTDLFDTNPDYKNNILRGDISPIMAMAEIIQKYKPDPKFYIILFDPLFDLYKSKLESKQIIFFTNKIIKFIANKKEVIYSNFNNLFEVLLMLKIHQEQEVKNSGNALDKLLKDSLQEYSDNMDLYKDYFDFNSFCEHIKNKMKLQQQILISLLFNWIGIICQIKQTGIVKFFHDILPLILNLQAGKDKDLSKYADNCFKIIKNNIEENFIRYYKYDKESIEKILAIVIKEASPNSNKISLPAWDLLDLYLRKSEQHIDIYLSKRDGKDMILNKNTISSKLDSPNLKDNDIKTKQSFKEGKAKSTMSLPKKVEKMSKNSNDKNMNLASSNNVYININDNDKKNNKRLSKNSGNKGPGGPSFEFKNYSDMQTFIGELLNDAQFSKDDNILEYIPFKLFSKILILITETYACDVDNIEIVNKLDDTLKRIINKSPKEINNYGFEHQEVTSILLIGIKNPTNKNKKRLLNWCEILYNKYGTNIFNNFNVFIKEFIQAIPTNKSEKTDFFMDMVQFLSNIKMEGDITNIIMKNLTEKLMEESGLMSNEGYVILILDNLSKNSSLDIVYESLVDVLKDTKNYSFVSKMIHCLNQYLMRNPKAVNFRKSLINNDNIEQYNKLFIKMYNIWAINPISLLIYCVITEHFEIAYNIILNLVKVQLDNDYYIHLGSLVQLLESELYDYIRIRLLEPTNNIYLIRTLYGILMLLPQGQAFNVLSNRMSNVQTLFEIENGLDNIKEEENKEEINKFIEIFLNIQKNKREEEDKKIKIN